MWKARGGRKARGPVVGREGAADFADSGGWGMLGGIDR